jgi:hypothetical protein
MNANQMTFRARITWAVAGGLVLLAIAATALIATSGASRAAGPRPDGEALAPQIAQGENLAKSPVPTFGGDAVAYRTVSDLSAAGARLAQSIPLPPGGSFDVINWQAAADQGGDTEGGIESVLEYQASCQWYRYALLHPASTDALTVMQDIASWPTFRANPTNAGQTAQTMVQALEAGKLDVIQAQVDTNCR